MANTTLKTGKERFEILDIVRGCALLGVLLANMQWHSYYGYLTAAEQALLPFAELNKPLTFLTYFILDGKFYTIFSMLFGLGFSLIISKSGGGRIIFRRLFVLMLFGFAHALLLWEGDILLLYAVLGFSLPLFNRLKNRTVLLLAVFLLLSPILLDGMRVASEGAFKPEQPLFEKNIELMTAYGVVPLTNSNIAKLQKHGDYKTVRKNLYAGFYWRWGDLIMSNRLPKVLGLFLIGLLIGRNRLFVNLPERVPELKRIRNWGFLIGLPISIIYAYVNTYGQNMPLMAKSTVYIFGVFPMAFAYGASLCLLYVQGYFSRIFKGMGYIGKMALSVYLTQSLIALLVFSGVGLGLATELGFAQVYAFGLVLFVLQMIFCRWWLSRYAFGPCEWGWRQLTYGKRIPLKYQT
ncbi:hypothetical protein MNBD_ALPHA01-2281 [hydrothermal vent metagenome]|uniref:DUF418 domain-containing protein n=1 Tax=hydrothermal vent metagenome TaxID=652676 RepID=A0A3B0SRZ3_9ZZZZ